MQLFACDRLLFFYFILPVFALAENAVKKQTQFYWKKKGDEEIYRTLGVRLNENVAKNVILFVGDGLGPNTITATRIYKKGEDGELSFESFPHVGLLKTYADDATVPDSACAATALFSGVKTNVDVVGVDSGVMVGDCQTSLLPEHRLSTIIDWAQQAGKDTGFVTTTRVTHATPSALYSHTANRKWECDAVMQKINFQCKDIARQLVEDEPGKNLKVIMGGGRQCLTWMIVNATNDPVEAWACRRADGRDLLDEWRKDKINRRESYRILNNTQDLRSLDYGETDFVMGIFANGHMMTEDRRDKTSMGMPSLPEMTAAAIKILQKNKNGYVLMVEGGLIDVSHHRGHARRALEETVQFAEAVDVAVKLTSDEDTLIIVTSDHAHNLNINGKTSNRGDILGIAANSLADGVPYTKLTYSTGERKNYQYEVKNGNVQRKDPTEFDTSWYNYSQQAGILSDEATHGGVDVSVFAKGPMSHLVSGVHEQSYVAYVVAYAARIGSYSNRQLPTTSCDVGTPKTSASRSSSIDLSIFGFVILHIALRNV